METDDPAAWTLEEHLAHGRAAVNEISQVPTGVISDPRVCFHFSPSNRDDDDNWGMDAGYCVRAQGEFARYADEFDVDFVGGLSGIEAWQHVLPSMAWLERTVPVVADIARKSGMSFVGWSFEPRRGPFVTVSPTLNVFDGSELSELPSDVEAESFGGLLKWLKRKLGG